MIDVTYHIKDDEYAISFDGKRTERLSTMRARALASALYETGAMPNQLFERPLSDPWAVSYGDAD